MFTLTPFGGRTALWVNGLRKEMDQLFDGVGGACESGKCLAPATNLSETEKAFELSLDLPGLKPDDFQIEFREGQLWISGERKQEAEEQGKTYHRVERRYGQFRRVVSLPDTVDRDNVTAQYRDGVLHVVVPKAEAVLPKKIQVTS